VPHLATMRLSTLQTATSDCGWMLMQSWIVRVFP
jgi:hypothetical protein